MYVVTCSGTERLGAVSVVCASGSDTRVVEVGLRQLSLRLTPNLRVVEVGLRQRPLGKDAPRDELGH